MSLSIQQVALAGMEYKVILVFVENLGCQGQLGPQGSQVHQATGAKQDNRATVDNQELKGNEASPVTQGNGGFQASVDPRVTQDPLAHREKG